jgi:hypothetical protein
MKYLYLVIPILFLGCSSERPLAQVLPTENSTDVPGTSLPMPDGNDVRNPEALKAYPVGRYEDPNDPSIMHEAHIIYRAEQPPTWNLNPTVSTAVPLGPTVAVADPARENSAMTGELEQKIQQQNQLLQATFEQNERLTEELKTLQDEVVKTRAIVATNEQLQKQVADLQVQLNKVQQQLAVQNHSVPSAAPKTAQSKSIWSFL